MKRFISRLLKQEAGSESAELGVGLSVIALGSVATYRYIQDRMSEGISTISDAIGGATVPEEG